MQQMYLLYYTPVILYPCYIIPLWFFKRKKFVVQSRGKICRFFGNELLKINVIDCNVPNYENPKKCKITPPYCLSLNKKKSLLDISYCIVKSDIKWETSKFLYICLSKLFKFHRKYHRKKRHNFLFLKYFLILISL